MIERPIDEAAAWDLVRAVPPGLAGRAQMRIPHHPRPDAWLQVDTDGGWEAPARTEEAQALLDLFVPLRVPATLVIAQIGQSLDGRIATETGHSHYVTGPADIQRLHRLRALVDAVVVGAGTVDADDPRLSVRNVPGRSPVRVVLDPTARLDRSRRVFSDENARTIEIRRTDATRAPTTPPDGIEIITLPGEDAGGRFAPAAIVRALRERGLQRLLIEGGGTTISAFLEAGVLDRLHVTVAPLLIGSGRPGLSLTPISSLENALRPRCRHFRLDDDILFDLDLRHRESRRP